MALYTGSDIVRIVDQEDISFVRMQFTDIFGQLKNVAITTGQIGTAMAGEVALDGSCIEGFVRIQESDQFLRPDPDSFAVLPWRPQRGKVARLICDVYNPDGTPFVGDPRGVLKKALSHGADMGYSFNVGPECEFFLFQTDDEGRPTVRTTDDAGYFDLGPLDHGEETRREICLALEEMGIGVEASHHEVSAGQHEIDLHYGDALRAADNLMTFKLAVKTLAQKNGLHATFMPKPIFGVNGSGMHINMSLLRGEQNAFFDPSDPCGLSREAYAFMAGLLAHAKALCALTNPLVNSYKRLVPGYEAPCYIAWSARNRSALVRIPSSRGQHTRIELRNPDPTCNPYLALAACLEAGLDGLKKGLTPPEEISANLFDMNDAERQAAGIGSLPRSLNEAIDALERDDLIASLLGDHIMSQYCAGKRREWEEYRTCVSSWEISRYLRAY